jgi:hypothetical protein
MTAQREEARAVLVRRLVKAWGYNRDAVQMLLVEAEANKIVAGLTDGEVARQLAFGRY